MDSDAVGFSVGCLVREVEREGVAGMAFVVGMDVEGGLVVDGGGVFGVDVDGGDVFVCGQNDVQVESELQYGGPVPQIPLEERQNSSSMPVREGHGSPIHGPLISSVSSATVVIVGSKVGRIPGLVVGR